LSGKSSAKIQKKPQKCKSDYALSAQKWHKKSFGIKLEKSWKISEVFRPKVGNLACFSGLVEKESEGAG
jgi:hypothetical protein